MNKTLKVLSLGSMVALSVISCGEFMNNPKGYSYESKEQTKKMLYERGISARKWEILENNAEKTHKSVIQIDNVIAERKYWDSIRTKALVEKAYQEGAQAVRDSLNKVANTTKSSVKKLSR